jgi:hypothetical protein
LLPWLFPQNAKGEQTAQAYEMACFRQVWNQEEFHGKLKSAYMKDDIQNAVGVLVGMPLWSLGRAVDLAWFEFGSRRTV